MNRRAFLAAAATSPVITASPLARAAPQRKPQQDLYDLRRYRFASPGKREAFETFLADVMVPAVNRAGISRVGVFAPVPAPDGKPSPDDLDLHVLLTHPRLDSVLQLDRRLAEDDRYQSAGKAILSAPKSDPAYVRIDATLLQAFAGFPRLKLPPTAADPSTPRVFELRTYESPNEERARNKVHMFEHGEFALFDRARMPCVFFGTGIAGAGLPHLTYLISHTSLESAKASWKSFFADPEWTRLKDDPIYQDNVSKVTNRFMRSARGSQI